MVNSSSLVPTSTDEMSVEPLEPDTPGVRCALEGCGAPLVRHAGGGRPRLYCSDAHRAEARRRRLGGSPGPGTSDALDDVRQLLTRAIAGLDAAPRTPDYDVVLADVRARTTAELLRAQQLAADVTRRALAAEQLLAQEHAARLAADDAATHRQRRDAETIGELSSALEGARSALDAELLGHHADVEALEGQLAAHQSLRVTERAAWENELGEWRSKVEALEAEIVAHRQHVEVLGQELAAAGRRAELAERQLATVERALVESCARADGLTSALKRSRADLEAERLQRGALMADLRRQAVGTPARPRPRRGSGTTMLRARVSPARSSN